MHIRFAILFASFLVGLYGIAFNDGPFFDRLVFPKDKQLTDGHKFIFSMMLGSQLHNMIDQFLPLSLEWTDIMTSTDVMMQQLLQMASVVSYDYPVLLATPTLPPNRPSIAVLATDSRYQHLPWHLDHRWNDPRSLTNQLPHLST